MNERRPNPDELLATVSALEEKKRRGRLKIFLGATAGVGKTYAMLSEARTLRAQGHDVVIGLVETHGRAETAALLEGLERLPLKEVAYQGKTFQDFDLDAALARRPVLLLVDELAHSNVAGLRHQKRWQDIEELIAAGINVYSTVNVQHLESLNDQIVRLTGVQVWETVPDRVIADADEVELVDIPTSSSGGCVPARSIKARTRSAQPSISFGARISSRCVSSRCAKQRRASNRSCRPCAAEKAQLSRCASPSECWCASAPTRWRPWSCAPQHDSRRQCTPTGPRSTWKHRV